MTARAIRTATLASTALVAGGLGAWACLRPRPTLEPALRLIEAGRADDAERSILAYVNSYPDDAPGLILLARIEVERLDRLAQPDPALAPRALASVRRARTDDKKLAALGHFYEGLLCESLMRLDEAEHAWLEAFRLDPAQTDPAWRLLQVYAWQGRRQEARELARRVYQLSPTPSDRLRALLELTSIEVHQPASIGVIDQFKPVVRSNPNDLSSALALGRALVREGRSEEGLKYLRNAVLTHPDDLNALDALLTGLEDAGQVESVEKALDQVPSKPGSDALRARHRGWVEQERQDWKAAVQDYRFALQSDPNDARLTYRLSRMLRHDGDVRGAEELERAARDRDAAHRALRTLYEAHATELKDGPPRADLYQQFADLHETMGRRDEARAWHALVLYTQPGNERSRTALERLKGR